MKVWVIHKLENWCLMRADGIFLEVMQCQQNWPTFVLKPPILEPQLLTLRWQKEDVYSSQRLHACLPTLYVISQATKGPATWCLQMQREANDSHTTNSSSVLPAWITELFPSGLLRFLPVAENLRLHCRLPTSRPDLTAICNSAYIGSPTVCIFVCKMSNLLLVAWLLCEVSRKGSSPRGTAGQWTQKSDPQAHGPRPAPAWML